MGIANCLGKMGIMFQRTHLAGKLGVERESNLSGSRSAGLMKLGSEVVG